MIRLGLVAAVLVALYFIATSDFVLRRLVLPRLVGDINGKVSVGAISLHPFSRLTLADLQVKLADGQTLLAAKEADVRYGLVSLLRGRWIVPEIRLVNPEFHLVQFADGTTSLERLFESDTPRRPQVVPRPEELLIGRLTVENGTFSYENQLPDGERTRVAGRELRLSLANLGNGRKAALELAGRIGMEKAGDTAGGRLILALESSTSTTLGRNLRPSEVKVGVRLEAQEATGTYGSLAGLSVRFDGDMSGKEIHQCLLRFEKAGNSLGSLQVTGPADFENLNLRLRASLEDLSHEVLDLLGSPFGVAFGEAKLAGNCLVDLSDDGRSLTVGSTLSGSGLEVQTVAGRTPALDFNFRLNGRVSPHNKTADIRALDLTVHEGGRELLMVSAPRTINLLWNPAVRSSQNDSSLVFRLNAIDLARWRPLFGPALPAGRVTIDGVLTNRDDGVRLRAWVTNRVDGLAFTAGPYAVSNASASLVSRLEFRDYFSLSAEETFLEAAVDGIPLVKGRGTGSYEFRNRELRLQFDLRGDASNLVARFPHPMVAATGGDFRFDGTTQFRGESGMAGVSLVLDGFHGRVDRYAFNGEWLRTDCSVDWNPELVAVRQFGVSVGRTAGAAGSVYATGRATQTGEASFELSAVNLGPDSLSPFLRPYFGAITLAGGTLEVPRAQVRLSPSGREDVELEVRTDHLVLRDNATGVSHFPLTMSTVLSFSRTGSRLEVTTNIITLPFTHRATNVVSATGELDLAVSNAEPGRLSIRSAGLDLTDLVEFYRTNQAAAGDSMATPSSAPAGEATHDRGSLALPEFVADLNVRRLFVAGMEATNWLAHVTSTNGLLRLDSLTAEIGGGGLRARGQTATREGGGATILQVAAEHLPVDPVSTAVFGVDRGRYAGDLSAELDYAGPALEGGSAAAPASGRFSLTATNLVCRVLPDWARRTLGPVASAFKMDDVLRSPLRYVGGRARLTGDSISLSDWTAMGDLFVLNLAGEVRLGSGSSWSDTSFDLPVGIALRETLAQRLPLTNLQPAIQPGYLQLPPLLSVEGTLSDWSPRLSTEDPHLLPAASGPPGPTIGGQTGESREMTGNLPNAATHSPAVPPVSGAATAEGYRAGNGGGED